MESSKQASNVWEDTQALYALSLPEGEVLEKERYNCGGIESFENECQKNAKLRWKHEYSWSQWQRAEGRGGVSVNNLRRVAGELG